MKARTLKDVEKAIKQEVDRENAALQYKLFDEVLDSSVQAAAVAMIAVFHKRGLSKKYIQKFFDEFIGVLDMPDVFGKAVTSENLMEQYSKEYGLDFSRIKVRRESYNEFKRRNKIR